MTEREARLILLVCQYIDMTFEVEMLGYKLKVLDVARSLQDLTKELREEAEKVMKEKDEDSPLSKNFIIPS